MGVFLTKGFFRGFELPELVLGRSALIEIFDFSLSMIILE